MIMSWSRGGKAYQDQNASKKPNHEKKNTRPYWLTGFKTGIDRAFLVIGLTSGLLQRSAGLKTILLAMCSDPMSRAGMNAAVLR